MWRSDSIKKILLIVLGVVLSIALVSILATGVFAVRANSYERAAEQGGEYLTRMLKDNGSFVYLYYPKDNTEIQSYNILRHAGTVYALLELAEYTQSAAKKEKLFGASRSALAYLAKQAKPCPDVPEALCIVEGNEIKLGGNGLALLSFAEYERLTNDTQYHETAEKLAAWIMASMSEEGEFTKHKIIGDSGELTDFVSEYYPGEALYGLLALYEIGNDEELLKAAQKGAHNIVESRQELYYTQLPHDHWLMYALNALHTVDGDKTWVEESYRLSWAIMSTQHPSAKEGSAAEIAGGFYVPPRVAPTATRVEGLKSAHAIFEREQLYYAQALTESAVRAGREFLLTTQITEETLAEQGFDKKALGGFPDKKDGESIRIDYVQHTISALLE